MRTSTFRPITSVALVYTLFAISSVVARAGSFDPQPVTDYLGFIKDGVVHEEPILKGHLYLANITNPWCDSGHVTRHGNEARPHQQFEHVHIDSTSEITSLPPHSHKVQLADIDAYWDQRFPGYSGTTYVEGYLKYNCYGYVAEYPTAWITDNGFDTILAWDYRSQNSLKTLFALVFNGSGLHTHAFKTLDLRNGDDDDIYIGRTSEKFRESAIYERSWPRKTLKDGYVAKD